MESDGSCYVFPADLGIKPFELIDDSTLLNMLDYFSGQTAARFARTCRRHSELYKRNEAHDRLRPLDNIRSMALGIPERFGEPILCINSQAAPYMNTILVPATASPFAETLFQSANYKPNFTLSARADKVDVYMDKISASPQPGWVVQSRIIKGSRDRTYKLVTEHLLSRIVFDELVFRQIDRKVVDFAVEINFSSITKIKANINRFQSEILRLLQGLPSINQVTLVGSTTVSDFILTRIQNLQTLRVMPPLQCNLNDQNVVNVKIPNFIVGETRLTPNGVRGLLAEWRRGNFDLVFWKFDVDLSNGWSIHDLTRHVFPMGYLHGTTSVLNHHIQVRIEESARSLDWATIQIDGRN